MLRSWAFCFRLPEKLLCLFAAGLVLHNALRNNPPSQAAERIKHAIAALVGKMPAEVRLETEPTPPDVPTLDAGAAARSDTP